MQENNNNENNTYLWLERIQLPYIQLFRKNFNIKIFLEIISLQKLLVARNQERI